MHGTGRKRLPWWIAAALICACTAKTRAQQVQVSPANRTIAITATESARHRADTAILHVGFETFAADSAQAYADAARLSKAIVAALAAAGIADDALESVSQSTEPTQPYQNQNLSPEEQARHKFEAQQSWTVKTTPGNVAAMLAASVDAGANASGQIEWLVADQASLTAEAGARALEDAQRQAAEMAAGLGAKVGSLLYASNQIETMQPVAVARPKMLAAGVAGGIGGGRYVAPQLNLQAPMITRTATVSAIFSIQ